MYKFIAGFQWNEINSNCDHTLTYAGNSCGQFLRNASKSIELIVRQEKKWKIVNIYEKNDQLIPLRTEQVTRVEFFMTLCIGYSDLFVRTE